MHVAETAAMLISNTRGLKKIMFNSFLFITNLKPKDKMLPLFKEQI